MRDSLFDDPINPAPASPELVKRTGKAAAAKVQPAPPDAAQQALAKTLPPQLRLGTARCGPVRWSAAGTSTGCTAAYGYEEAKQLYEPFDKLVDPDPETRATLARVIAGSSGAGHAAYVTINNKAEGSAPLSVLALAQALSAQALPAGTCHPVD